MDRRHAHHGGTRPLAAALLASAAGLALAATGATAAPAQPAGGQYTAILSNPFMGNDWRPQMQRYASFVAENGPLKPKLSSFRIVTTQGNDPNQQNAAFQSAILEKPDIILATMASETASNQMLARACSRGIVVVTFDVQASAPCAWKLAPDWEAVGRSWADWAARSSGGSGTILVDRGQAGASSSNGMNRGIDAVLKKYPNLKVKTYFSKFSPGEETSKVSQLLAANADTKAIISQAYGAQEALRKAKLKIPATGFNYPPTMKSCVDSKMSCLLIGVPPWIVADAMKLAVDVKDGKVKGNARFVPFGVPLFTSNTTRKPLTANLGKVYDLKAQLPSAPAGAFLPVSPPWVKVDFAQIRG